MLRLMLKKRLDRNLPPMVDRSSGRPDRQATTAIELHDATSLACSIKATR
jgi:hypothetical protein